MKNFLPTDGMEEREERRRGDDASAISTEGKTVSHTDRCSRNSGIAIRGPHVFLDQPARRLVGVEEKSPRKPRKLVGCSLEPQELICTTPLFLR